MLDGSVRWRKVERKGRRISSPGRGGGRGSAGGSRVWRPLRQDVPGFGSPARRGARGQR